jgi:hypothetical protein
MRLSQHDIALQRERLLTEITILSEQEQSQVIIAHKARVLLSTAWFKATWAGKQDILRAVDWLLRLERKRVCPRLTPSTKRLIWSLRKSRRNHTARIK